jgi:ElaB/YqjD/DUF883 family membrane-anchored ribosome-binding protein
MTHLTNEMTKDQLIKEFQVVLTDTEQLLKTAANAGGEKADILRASVEQNMAKAKERLNGLQRIATDRAMATAHATDEYVHGNPWQSMGMVAGISVAVGIAAGLLLNRR